ncbi:MAG TPA: hypothetical protein VJR92_12915 [Gemmatimonadaceae bacterium]|nr:hypothetical protein [Gemmatimonadaceae bacterium]
MNKRSHSFAPIAVAAVLVIATSHVLIAEQNAGFVGVVGNWSHVDDGGAAFKVDTTGWSGTTDRAALQSLSRSLFATVNDTFVTNGTAPEAFPIAVHSATSSFTKGTLSVRFKLVGGVRDFTAGIMFNLKSNGEYMFVRYNTLDGNIALWRFRNGARERVLGGEMETQLAKNTWHELSMTVSGNALSARVNDGALKQDFTLTEPVAGRVGLWTKREAVTVFRDFRVTP